MIFVFLTGGLGNQMFQYACGRSLAIKRGEELALMLNDYDEPGNLRKYMLSYFNIVAKVKPTLEILSNGLVWSVTQMDSHFHKSLFHDRSPNLVLRGFWETEKYFADIQDVIRRDFTLKQKLSPQCLEIARQLKSSESVCLHVRRTDFLNPKNNKGFVELGYYKRAINFMQSRLKQPVFYVFSDDIQWCAKHLRLPNAHYFMEKRKKESPSLTDVTDLVLMSMCKHFILANSTFSWWGAWLGTFEGKLVVAPRRWFRRDNIFWNSTDIIPAGWTRL